jgi:uncharacterized membrane protein
MLDRRLATLVQIAGLAAAIGLSGYLSYMKFTVSIPPCTGGGGCAAALYSEWGYLVGIPLAYIGLGASLVLLALTPWAAQPVRVVSLALFAVGAVFTIYLRYVEQAHFNGNVCIWCVSFMGAWWVAMAAEIVRLVRQPRLDAATT